VRVLRAVSVMVVAGACAAALGASAPTASAGLLTCDGQASAPAFLRWLDPSPYSLVPGGDFEGAHGWQLSGGARVESGNEPFGLRSGSSSLFLPPGASATSPATCVGTLALTSRFVASNTGSLLSPLKVEIVYTTSSGAKRSALVALRLGGAAWSPGVLPDVFLLSSLGPLLSQLGEDGLTSRVQFRFTSQSSLLLGSGRWRIDDVFVDPWLSRGG
jgi:hypothetical protein